MYRQITKESFYRGGGFSNPRQFRKMQGGEWTYWEILR